MTDLYQLFGVRRGATKKAIKSAYRKRSLAEHPDRNPGDDGAKDRFNAVNQAYKVLMDDALRREYDATGEVPDLSPDKALSHHLEMLSEAMVMTIRQLVDANQDPTEADVVGMMTKILEANRDKLEKMHAGTGTMKAKLLEIAGRFSAIDCENFLETLARRRVEQFDKQLAALTVELDKNVGALALLKKFKFRWEKKRQPWSGAATVQFQFIQM